MRPIHLLKRRIRSYEGYFQSVESARQPKDSDHSAGRGGWQAMERISMIALLRCQNHEPESKTRSVGKPKLQLTEQSTSLALEQPVLSSGPPAHCDPREVDQSRLSRRFGPNRTAALSCTAYFESKAAAGHKAGTCLTQEQAASQNQNVLKLRFEIQ